MAGGGARRRGELDADADAERIGLGYKPLSMPRVLPARATWCWRRTTRGTGFRRGRWRSSHTIGARTAAASCRHMPPRSSMRGAARPAQHSVPVVAADRVGRQVLRMELTDTSRVRRCSDWPTGSSVAPNRATAANTPARRSLSVAKSAEPRSPRSLPPKASCR
jgi:hypothetical protein